MLLGCSKLFAQEATIELPEVKVMARAQQGRILLRWTANTPLAWQLSNRYGYELVRYTVTRDRKTLKKPEIKKLGIIMPDPLESWENLIDQNDNAAIIAQAIYGDSFQVTGGTELEAVVNMSAELEQRFTFALFVADQDFDVAVKAGLGYIDTDVKNTEKYAYKLIPQVPEDVKVIKEGGVFVGLSDYEALPKPLDLSVFLEDGGAKLSWNYKIFKDLYTSYHIERAANGSGFERITDKPYTMLNASGIDEKSGRIFYLDSVQNNVEYRYRVRGISAFGEVSPPSKEASGIAKKILAYVPHLRTKKILNESTVKLTWEFPEEGKNQIQKFELNRASTDAGPYKVVVDNIAPNQREVVFDQLESTNYFTITAVGKQNNRRTSFSMLVQPIDSIPPKVPNGLKATIDTTGVVTLSWNKNTEKDFLGYRVYMANQKNTEYSPLFADPQQNNVFQDTLNMKNSNRQRYYKISALDKRFNMSELSIPIEVVKPDLIPPTTPVFKHYNVQEDHKAISLSWAASSSIDVARYVVYRKTNTDKEWQLVFEGNKDQLTCADKKIEEGNRYTYTVLAIDESGLESTPAPSVSVQVRRMGVRPKVKGFYVAPNYEQQRMEISWRYKEDNVAEFEIYRAGQDGLLRLWRKAPTGTKVIYDTNMTVNTKYVYKIRAVFKDGNVSETHTTDIKY